LFVGLKTPMKLEKNLSDNLTDTQETETKKGGREKDEKM